MICGLPSFIIDENLESKCVQLDVCCAVCDITVLLMCAVTVWQQVSRMEIGDNPKATDDTVDSFWNFVELAFTALFALEVVRVTCSARYVLTS